MYICVWNVCENISVHSYFQSQPIAVFIVYNITCYIYANTVIFFKNKNQNLVLKIKNVNFDVQNKLSLWYIICSVIGITSTEKLNSSTFNAK